MNPVIIIIIIIGYPTEIKVKVHLDFSQIGGTYLNVQVQVSYCNAWMRFS